MKIGTAGMGQLTSRTPKPSMNGRHTLPNKLFNAVQALGVLYTKALSFQPPMESLTAMLTFNCANDNNHHVTKTRIALERYDERTTGIVSSRDIRVVRVKAAFRGRSET